MVSRIPKARGFRELFIGSQGNLFGSCVYKRNMNLHKVGLVVMCISSGTTTAHDNGKLYEEWIITSLFLYLSLWIFDLSLLQWIIFISYNF